MQSRHRLLAELGLPFGCMARREWKLEVMDVRFADFSYCFEFVALLYRNCFLKDSQHVRCSEQRESVPSVDPQSGCSIGWIPKFTNESQTVMTCNLSISCHSCNSNLKEGANWDLNDQLTGNTGGMATMGWVWYPGSGTQPDLCHHHLAYEVQLCSLANIFLWLSAC